MRNLTFGSLAAMGLLCGALVFGTGAAPADDERGGRIEQWEYKVVSAAELAQVGKVSTKELLDREASRGREENGLARLNALGSEGWELITVNESHFFFKRRKVGD